MNRILIALAFVAIAAAQNRHQGSDPRTAAILSEQRYLTGDGTFGTQYKQEDGVEFKEESDQYGNRKGSYSYVDATGQTKTVHYTAGKDGFHATGDHLPQAAVPPPQYTPDPKYNPPQYQEPDQYQSEPQYQQPRQQYQQPKSQYQEPQKQYKQPRPQYQPQQQYQQPQQQYQQSQPQYQPQAQYQEPQQQPQYRPQPQYQPTTAAPHRYYPPGKLSLQRSPDGFAYSFNKS